MLSFQVAGLIEDASKEITENNAFVAAIELFAGPLEYIAKNLALIGTNSNNAAYGNEIFSILSSFKELKSSISPRRFYSDLEIIQASLRHFKSQLTDTSEYVESLVSDVDGFASMFDTYLANPSAVNAAPISIAASRLAQRFRDFKGSLHLFNSMIQKLPSQQDDDSMLSIVLSGPFDLREFIARLEAIESMYSELCQLLNISETDYPLEIAKIESGSLLAKVAGSAVVLSLMTSFIQSTATYMYESYTVEGRIKTIPPRVESLDKVIDLTRKLKEAGIDTSEMESHVAKSAHTIAKDLNTLVEGQPSIILNGLEITGTSEESRRQISFKNVPRLSGKSGI
jgi:hypothetical protein